MDIENKKYKLRMDGYFLYNIKNIYISNTSIFLKGDTGNLPRDARDRQGCLLSAHNIKDR